MGPSLDLGLYQEEDGVRVANLKVLAALTVAAAAVLAGYLVVQSGEPEASTPESPGGPRLAAASKPVVSSGSDSSPGDPVRPPGVTPDTSGRTRVQAPLAVEEVEEPEHQEEGADLDVAELLGARVFEGDNEAEWEQLYEGLRSSQLMADADEIGESTWEIRQREFDRRRERGEYFVIATEGGMTKEMREQLIEDGHLPGLTGVSFYADGEVRITPIPPEEMPELARLARKHYWLTTQAKLRRRDELRKRHE